MLWAQVVSSPSPPALCTVPLSPINVFVDMSTSQHCVAVCFVLVCCLL